MKNEKRLTAGSVILPFLPLLALPALFFPYRILNENVLVKKFGCGCVEGFNANTVTYYFVFAVTLLCIAAFVLLWAKKAGFAPAGKKMWAFALCLLLFLAAACLIGANFIYLNMWN